MSIWDIVVPVVGTLAGTWLASSSAGKAAEAQAQGSQAAADASREMYYQSRKDLAPYRDVGGNALYQLAAGAGLEYEGAPGSIEDRYQTAMSRFQTSPDYQFRLGEGIKAIDRSAAARGRLNSGATMKAVQDFGQGVAAGEWGNYQNRLANLAGVGQTATSQTGALGSTTAGRVGSALQDAGTARASGYAGKSNAITGGINNLLYYYGRA